MFTVDVKQQQTTKHEVLHLCGLVSVLLLFLLIMQKKKKKTRQTSENVLKNKHRVRQYHVVYKQAMKSFFADRYHPDSTEI